MRLQIRWAYMNKGICPAFFLNQGVVGNPHQEALAGNPDTLVIRGAGAWPRLSHNFMPIGQASCRTYDERGLAVWTIRIGKEVVPGLWIIVDREFRPGPSQWVAVGASR